VKKSLLVEAQGGPLSIVVAAANVNDAPLLEATLEAIVIERPADVEQALLLDKGYDNPTGRAAAQAYGYRAHIRQIGQEKLDDQQQPRYPARRYVVERTLAWLSKCRGLLVRYEKKSENYLGLLQWACALLWYRRLVTLSEPPYLR
jgi:putative transposase